MSFWGIITAWAGGWLANLWSGISSAVDNIDREVSSRANEAANAVGGWASSQISSAKDYLLGVIENVKLALQGGIAAVKEFLLGKLYDAVTLLRGLVADARSYLLGKLDDLKAAYKLAVSNLKTYLLDKIADVRDAYKAAVAALKLYLLGKISDAEDKVTKLFTPLLAFLPWLKLAQPLLDGTALAKLKDFSNRLYAFVNSFARDPVGYILGMLWSTFVNYLCFALAYGLGTVTATLPPIPKWGSGGGGIIPPVYPPIPGEYPGLVHPCTPLYVSGYTFTPTHPGTDFGIVNAQAIFAAHDGTVEEAHWVDYGFGWTITIRGGHFWSRYGHLEQLLVSSGTVVSAGSTIAYGNSTGNSTGPHLHFELRIDGVYTDPVSVL